MQIYYNMMIFELESDLHPIRTEFIGGNLAIHPSLSLRMGEKTVAADSIDAAAQLRSQNLGLIHS